jgi:hypothetical protein
MSLRSGRKSRRQEAARSEAEGQKVGERKESRGKGREEREEEGDGIEGRKRRERRRQSIDRGGSLKGTGSLSLFLSLSLSLCERSQTKGRPTRAVPVFSVPYCIVRAG